VNLPSPPYPKTNDISIRWVGQVQTTIAGTYTFTVTSDDGQRLWVNGTNLVDDWISEGATPKSGSITLAANTRYDIVMEYMNIAGGASSTLAWTLPGDSVSAIIPTDFLYLPNAGNLVVGGTSQLTLSGSNSFSGGTTVANGGTLEASGDNTLGQGNVYINNNGQLVLQNGVTNGYISPAGDLVMNGADALAILSYTGTNTIHGFSTNGGTTYLPTGTYGASGSGATFQLFQFIGTGILNVTAIPSTTTLTSSSGNTAYGSSVTFTSTVSGSGPTPTGTVTFYDGASAIGMATLSGGQATFAASDLQVATSPHSITAVYSGDPNYVQSTSSALTQTVSPLTISPVTLAVSNKVYDSTVNASIIASNCTVSGVLPADTNGVHVGSATATFSDKNIGTNKTVSVSGITLVGSVAGNYLLSPNSETATANITQAGLSIIDVTANNKTYDGTTLDPLNAVSATLIGAFPGDVVSLNNSGAIGNFATAAVGNNKAVTVSGFTLNGTDATNYSLAQPTGLNASITQASTTNIVGSSANPAAPAATVHFTSTPTPIAPGAGTPTGNVIFLTNGVAFSTNALSSGVATSLSTTNLPVGTNTITAQYAGDANFTGSTGTLAQMVGGAPPGALSISLVGTNVVVNWSGSFTLQSAPAVNSTNSGFADVLGPVLTGPYTNTNAAAKTFFRLRN
jgi:autotransporter-associated beta strand protein